VATRIIQHAFEDFPVNKILTTLMTAGALALAAAPVLAAPPDQTDTYFLNLDFDDVGLGQHAFFGGGFFSGVGTTFVEDYIFNSPPLDSYVHFETSADGDANGDASVMFTGFSLFTFQPGEDPVFIPLSGSLGDFALFADSISPLFSGIYVMEIRGTSLVDGSSFSGYLSTQPVPEPETWALMAMGLGALGFAARRRTGVPA
jgi:hypothetical protein